jgi:hypothetical protein
MVRPSAGLASRRLGHHEEGLEDQPFMDEMEESQDVA